MAGEGQLPLFDLVDLGSYDPDHVEAATTVAATILRGGTVLLETCSSIADKQGISRQAVSYRYRTGGMPKVYLCTVGGSPYWLPYQVAEFVERQNAEKDS